MTKLHHELDEQVHVNTQLLAENSSKQVELRNKEEELTAAHAEVARIVKVRSYAHLLPLTMPRLGA
jgi:hypothetical protein